MTPNELVREEADFIEIQRRKELRDHFAGLAMQGFCSNPGPQILSASSDNIAGWAYAQADSMIRSREAGQ